MEIKFNLYLAARPGRSVTEGRIRSILGQGKPTDETVASLYKLLKESLGMFHELEVTGDYSEDPISWAVSEDGEPLSFPIMAFFSNRIEDAMDLIWFDAFIGDLIGQDCGAEIRRTA